MVTVMYLRPCTNGIPSLIVHLEVNQAQAIQRGERGN